MFLIFLCAKEKKIIIAMRNYVFPFAFLLSPPTKVDDFLKTLKQY